MQLISALPRAPVDAGNGVALRNVKQRKGGNKATSGPLCECQPDAGVPRKPAGPVYPEGSGSSETGAEK